MKPKQHNYLYSKRARCMSLANFQFNVEKTCWAIQIQNDQKIIMKPLTSHKSIFLISTQMQAVVHIVHQQHDQKDGPKRNKAVSESLQEQFGSIYIKCERRISISIEEQSALKGPTRFTVYLSIHTQSMNLTEYQLQGSCQHQLQALKSIKDKSLVHMVHSIIFYYCEYNDNQEIMNFENDHQTLQR
ncbi:unnamed protein product (macronuclear) [Paramecium tetraurelia]|uniref:Uncharacterized protein n=1 Tax=Paramecium tetraurelia TaxID=5888 RepID=A0DA49_PARTE|nr:uncharacterized protein GSPATT00039366001 [Paramecium tetraurelia]CAK79916.1 unnamed protein product [Paramecium tetraurelia]|eukprot:XP_001447313.1 hypothetical protein (macronuclear) [Paramecium tetraurelia strain d4-2]